MNRVSMWTNLQAGRERQVTSPGPCTPRSRRATAYSPITLAPRRYWLHTSHPIKLSDFHSILPPPSLCAVAKQPWIFASTARFAARKEYTHLQPETHFCESPDVPIHKSWTTHSYTTNAPLAPLVFDRVAVYGCGTPWLTTGGVDSECWNAPRRQQQLIARSSGGVTSAGIQYAWRHGQSDDRRRGWRRRRP